MDGWMDEGMGGWTGRECGTVNPRQVSGEAPLVSTLGLSSRSRHSLPATTVLGAESGPR